MASERCPPDFKLVNFARYASFKSYGVICLPRKPTALLQQSKCYLDTSECKVATFFPSFLGGQYILLYFLYTLKGGVQSEAFYTCYIYIYIAHVVDCIHTCTRVLICTEFLHFSAFIVLCTVFTLYHTYNKLLLEISCKRSLSIRLH